MTLISRAVHFDLAVALASAVVIDQIRQTKSLQPVELSIARLVGQD
jgi:hypothetical protein